MKHFIHILREYANNISVSQLNDVRVFFHN